MNGARSTFKRKGYLLTALAAAVLLAASPGTAEAQSISFVGSSGPVGEGATTAQNPALMIKVKRSAAPAAPAPDNVGAVSVRIPSAALGFEFAYEGAGSATGLVFDANNESTITVTQTEDATNWKSETLTIEIQAAETGVSGSGSAFMITSVDNEVQPTASFSRTNIALTENSSTKLTVNVGVGTSQTAPTDALATLSDAAADALQIMVTPANAFAAAADGGVAMLLIGTATDNATPVANMPGVYDLGPIATVATTPVDLEIMANADMTGFQDPQITLEFVAKSLMKTTTGDVMAGTPATINIHSDEPVPTLSFSPTDVTVDEGGSVETVLIAEGAHGSEVGMVKLMVEGDAMVSLMHGGEMLEEMDGHVYVDLGASNSARLTAMSHSDPDLMDGDTKYKAWKLMEGSTDGANIGEGYWFRVDVMGSTAVPALPLVGQLLLALFLMAGGSRLYRRRQG